jgi:hypothetical protein
LKSLYIPAGDQLNSVGHAPDVHDHQRVPTLKGSHPGFEHATLSGSGWTGSRETGAVPPPIESVAFSDINDFSNSFLDFFLFVMAYIPEDAKWYLAWVVEEMTIEGDPRNVVHINQFLIRADSPDEAYEKALEIGRESEMTYENTDGRRVVCSFRGLQDLQVIHDELEHGAELSYEEKVDMPAEKIKRMVREKAELGVFLPDELPDHPNYMPNTTLEEFERSMAKGEGADKTKSNNSFKRTT